VDADEDRRMPTQIRFPAQDGTPLAASLFEPAEGAPPRAAVLIASAMGVPRRLYQAFAEHLAREGLAVLTFDYRGVGESRPASLKGYTAHLHDWAEQDLAGAIAHLEGRYPGAPLLYIGHSVGGQLLGLTPGADRLKAALFVASQSGYWRNWTGLHRARMLTVWHAVIPAMTGLFGYLPMRYILGGEDVPAGVGREWARWGRDPEYVRGFARRERQGGLFARLSLPILSYAVTGDTFAPPATVEALLSFYERAGVTLRTVGPAIDGETIGHFGFFSRRFQASLWPEARAFLLAHADTKATLQAAT